MNVENANEVWQVEVAGQVYEAPLSELPSWIDEGSLQPDDKIRKGNLRWIEARKVPTLIPFFNARGTGTAPAVNQTTTVAESAPAEPVTHQVGEASVKTTPAVSRSAAIPRSASHASGESAVAPAEGSCSRHPERPSAYKCDRCSQEFCKVCPSSYGGNVRICPDCGSMCKTTLEVAQANRAKSSTGIDSTNFGLSDLSNALAYPFRFKPSLVFGGLMFMFFNFGQSASAIGGIVLAAASLICVMLANMLTFGVLANTVDNFSQGKLDADFMPSFDDFSLWGDVVHPFLLSVAVYISSFGPFLAVAIAGVFLVMSAAGEQSKKFNNELTKVPGTEFYAPDRTAEQSREVRELLEMVKRQNDQRFASQKKAVETAETGAVENEPAQQDEAVNVAAMEKEIADRAAQSQQPSTTPAEVRAQYASSYASILRLAAPLVIAGLIALLWGLIYFPAACAVAGYTRSFFATLNPLVGLDTIRRLGVDYLKLLLMGVLILIISGILGMLLQAILSPFNLPSVGNIPARAVSSLFTFYFSVVFSCLLGYALFKAADRLKLAR